MINEKQVVDAAGRKKPRYLFVGLGTSLLPTLAEVRLNIPKAFSDEAAFVHLDTNGNPGAFDGVTNYLLGPQCRGGKGCGGKRELGKGAFAESKDDLFQKILVTEGVAGVFIIVAPGRGGTGTGAIIDLCLTFKEKEVPIIPFVFKPSEFAHEVGSLQFRDFHDVCAELYQQKIKFFLLNQDWVYQNVAGGNPGPLRESRSRMHQKVVESIAMVSIFWAGNPLIDPGDLEEQVLWGAGNTKVVRAEVDFSATNHKEAVGKAVKECLEDKLFELKGPAHYIVSYQGGDWFPAHNAALCELVNEYCAKSLADWNAAQTEPDSYRLEELLFIHKQVPLDPEPDANAPALVTQAPAESVFPFSKPADPVVTQAAPETPHLKGSLTLLISTIIPEPPSAEAGQTLEPAAAPDEALLTNGHAASVSQLRLAAKPPAQITAPVVTQRASNPSVVKLSAAELQEARTLHSEVFNGTTAVEELTLTGAIRRIDILDRLVRNALIQMEPEKFFRLLNQIRRDAKLASYVFGWDELSTNLHDFARKGAVEALWSSHQTYTEQLAGPDAAQFAKKVWVLWLLQVAQSANLDFPTFSLSTSTTGKRRLSITMEASEFGSLAACAKKGTAEEKQRMEFVFQLEGLKSLFQEYFKDVFGNGAELWTASQSNGNSSSWLPSWGKKTPAVEAASH